MKGGDEASFDIEARRIQAKLSLERGSPQKCPHSAIASAFSRIPNDLVSGEVALLIFELIGAGFDLLQTKHIRLLFPHPVQRALAKRGSQSIDIP